MKKKRTNELHSYVHIGTSAEENHHNSVSHNPWRIGSVIRCIADSINLKGFEKEKEIETDTSVPSTPTNIYN